MTATDDRDRIDALEANSAHQDRSLTELSDAVAEQWKGIEALTREVLRLRDEVQGLSRGGSRARKAAAALLKAGRGFTKNILSFVRMPRFFSMIVAGFPHVRRRLAIARRQFHRCFCVARSTARTRSSAPIWSRR